ncbi:hypothetical protein FI667_g78, partial [Globisporangium splendens]
MATSAPPQVETFNASRSRNGRKRKRAATSDKTKTAATWKQHEEHGDRLRLAAFEGASRFLTSADVTRCLVYAVEYEDRALLQVLDGCFNAVSGSSDRGTATSIAYKVNGAPDLHLRRTNAIMAWMDTFHSYTFPREVVWESARCGDLKIVQWLHTTTQYEPHVAMEFATRGGQLEIAKWLAGNVRTSLDFQRNQRNVIGTVVSSLHSSSDTGNDNENDNTNAIDHTHRTRAALAPRCRRVKKSLPLADTIDAIAYAGNLELLKSIKRKLGDDLLREDSGLDPNSIDVGAVMRAGVKNNHFPVWRYRAAAMVYEPTVVLRDIAQAYFNGTLEVLRYLVKQYRWNVPWGKIRFSCPWLSKMATWTQQNGFTRSWSRGSPYTIPMKKKRLKLRFKETKSIRISGTAGNFDVVEWTLGVIQDEKKHCFSVDAILQYRFARTHLDQLHVEWACGGRDVRKHDHVWRKRYVELLLRYTPEHCVAIEGLVMWAARFGYVEILQQMYQATENDWKRHSVPVSEIPGRFFKKTLLKLSSKARKLLRYSSHRDFDRKQVRSPPDSQVDEEYKGGLASASAVRTS